MFSKELVKSTYKLANQKYFEEKYEKQFQSIVDAAHRREKSIVFSQNECPYELAQYLMDELGFGLCKFEKNYCVPIFEIEEAKNCERILVKW